MLGPEEAYEGLYGQGPPSVHSSHGGRAFHQQGMYARFHLPSTALRISTTVNTNQSQVLTLPIATASGPAPAPAPALI